MDGAYVCLCSDLLHVWSVGRPADCSDCSSPDACGGADHGTARGTLGEALECVCECTERFTGKSCDVERKAKQLPFSPGVSVGLTFGVIGVVGLVVVVVLCSRADAFAALRQDSPRAHLILIYEFIDWFLDWGTFVLAFYAGDLTFDNDPDNSMRTFIATLCAVSTVGWLAEFALFVASKAEFCRWALRFNFLFFLVEDLPQVVLYSIVASGNASSGDGVNDSALKNVFVAIAGLQSLAFLIQKVYEMFREDRAVAPQVTSGSQGTELPAVGVTVGEGRRARVDPEGLDWASWAEQVSSQRQVRAFFERRQHRSDGGAKLRIESIVKVENDQTLSRFQSTGSFDIRPLQAHQQRCDTLLFHGCPQERGLNIQATGLLLRHAGNGMLGRGLYGAPDPRKSMNYCTSEDKFMFICRFRLDASARHAALPSTQHRNTVFDEFCVYDERHVVVLWMLKVSTV